MSTNQAHAPATQAHEPVLDAEDDRPEADLHHCAEPYGWTPFNQALFLIMSAEGETVEHAASCCGLTASSAYALRKRASGQVFALGWQAARVLARERLADLAFTRSVEGWDEVVTRTRTRDEDADTVTTSRRRIDNGLLSRQLARLDAQAREDGPDAAARIIAREFDAFIDLVRAGASPARVGLFLRNHGLGKLPPALEPLVALARADTMLRAGAGLAAEVDVADLDPADRAHWTADQWRRAEAAGLVTLAPPPPAPANDAFEGQISQAAVDRQIWYDHEERAWRTDFPPPADYDGIEWGDYGEDDYHRELSNAEQAVVDADEAAEVDERRTVETALRDAYFGFAGGAPAPDEDEEDDAPFPEASSPDASPADAFSPPAEPAPPPPVEPGCAPSPRCSML
ncbi:hypothetical protein D1610_13395 [Sphingomonas gilva]|uniref:Uncharacterized protein n=1 Tax=Sphingomonas gilva TaxID=2305907 RepID=A0A396RKW5_9SPHN|nr:hypothetical protein [Sphingomonas gilva]RHW16729.1 hypothetical protein D1610_13395 [Sphingomonas gilva]